jgi:uncharacterized protein
MTHGLLARFGGLFLAVWMLLAGTTAGALSVPAAPPLERPIVDQTGALSDQQISDLAAKIKAGRAEKDYQLGILMVPTLEGRDIEGYSIDVARAWGIGEADKDNGVLLIIAKNDRKLRLEIGNGLEGDITDLESGHIIRDVITPKFKTGDYYGGISDGVGRIQEAVEGEVGPAKQPANAGEGIAGILFQGGIFILWGGMWLTSILARTKSWWAGGVIGGIIGAIIGALAGWALWSFALLGLLFFSGLALDWAVSRNYHRRADRGESPAWWAGGTHLGGGGGGGGSFGGGGFSGGGASGDW